MTYAAGEVGQAFSLDGVSDGVVIGNPANLQLQDFTIEAWIKRASSTKSTSGPYHGAAIFAYSTGGYGLTIADDGHLFLTKVWNSNVGSTLTVSDTNWHHVAATKSGSRVIFYVDGVADTPLTYDPGFTFTSRAAIGDNPDNPGVGFFGLIDEVSIYNRALAATEVGAIYNASSAGKCLPAVVPDCVPVSSGLVSWWKGDGTATDVAGSNPGTLAGNATFGAGLVGQAFSFDGANDGVSFGNPASLQLQNFTIEAWIKRSDTNKASLDIFGDGTIFSYGYSGYNFAVLDDGRIVLGKVGISGVSSTKAVRDMNWHHVAVTKVGTSVVFYIDGVGETAPSYDPGFTFTTDAQIGAIEWDGPQPRASFLGLLDEVSIYNRALSDSEVASIFNANAAGKCPPISEPECVQPPSGLVNWWKGDGNANDAIGTSGGSPRSYVKRPSALKRRPKASSLAVRTTPTA